MRDIFRAYIARLFRNKLFLAGTALAFAITYYITANGLTIHRFGMYETDFDYTLTVSLGIPCFFSVFTASFLGTEYSEGTIRNKIAGGKTRTGIYAASFAVMAAALLTMTAAWLAGGLLGANTLPDSVFIVQSAAKVFFYNLANIAVLVLLSMMITKPRISIVLEFCIFEFGAFAALAFQGLMVIAKDGAYSVLRFLNNFLPFGQWLTSSLLGDREYMMSFGTLTCFSLMITAAMTAAGLVLIRKKDIK